MDEFQKLLGNPLLTVSIIAGVIGAVILWKFLSERKRREALREFAHRSGYSFDPKPPGADLAPPDTYLFGRGRGRKVRNLLQCRRGEKDLAAFDYTFTTGSGKNSSAHRQTVILVISARVDLPRFSLRPENILHKIGGIFGLKDIDFDRSPEFSKRYLLQGGDESRVRALFRPDVLRYFERNPGWCVEGLGQILVVYRDGKRVDPEDLPALISEATALFDRFRT